MPLDGLGFRPCLAITANSSISMPWVFFFLGRFSPVALAFFSSAEIISSLGSMVYKRSGWMWMTTVVLAGVLTEHCTQAIEEVPFATLDPAQRNQVCLFFKHEFRVLPPPRCVYLWTQQTTHPYTHIKHIPNADTGGAYVQERGRSKRESSRGHALRRNGRARDR